MAHEVAKSTKNILLISAVALGGLLISAGLLSKDRVADPKSLEAMLADQASVDSVATELDSLFQRRWQQAGIQSALPADNMTIIRRLSQGLTGSIPSLEELRRIERVAPDQQVQWWLARLLDDRRTSDHLAERLARAYAGVENGPFILFRRHRFVDWLSNQLHARRPYDEVVRELVASTGLWTDTPSTNFITIAAQDEQANNINPVLLTAKTSRALLGVRLDCLECHNDFLGNVQLGDPSHIREGQQIDFHQLAAFFGQVAVTPAGVQDRETSEPYAAQLLGESEASPIQPEVPYWPHLLPTTGTLRQRLAAWITHPENKPFARVTVNRLWAVMMGTPIVESIDDISLVDKLPDELEVLAEDFVAHDFDLYRTLRVIASSQLFRLDSRLDQEITPTHDQLRAVYPLVRLRPEQMAISILQATSLTTIDYSSGILNRLISFGSQRDFIDRYGDFGKDEFITRSETVTQRLLLFNGDLVRQRINEDLLAANQLMALSHDDRQLAQTLYLACLSRYPNPDETAMILQRLKDRGDQSRRQVVGDLYWAMLNSTEFGWSH